MNATSLRPLRASVLLSTLAAASFSLADTITFQQGVGPTGSYAGSFVTFGRSDNASTNNDTNTAMLVGNSASGADFHGFLSFDLSEIPAGATINSVSLGLYVNGDAGSTASSIQVDLVALTRSFTASQATWNSYSTGNAWTTPGGDFSPTVLSSVSSSPQLIGARTFASSTDFVSIAQSALDSSLPINLMLKLNNETGTTRNIFFYASDLDTTGSRRPSLTIDYTPAAVPEPSSFALLAGAAGLFVVGSRRRAKR